MNSKKENRILVADDDDDDYLIFSIALEDVPLKVSLSRVADGEKLLELVLKTTPDILFLDVQLPLRNGRECLTHMRSQDQYTNLKIVIYTSMEDDDSVDFCHRGKANLFMVKPNSVFALTGMLSHILVTGIKDSSHFPTREKFVMRANASSQYF